MIPYTAPTQDQLLAIKVNAGMEELAVHEKYAAAEPDMVEAIVGGIGEFAAGEWAPLNRIGDIDGAKLENGVVRLPDGFEQAYHGYVEQGWNAISGPVKHGGQGLPFTLACNVLENLGAANFAFNLLPMLSVGSIEALEHHGSEAQQAKYLPKLVAGAWSGTMNLTEPQAGSDVGALRTTATPIEEGEHAGKWAIKGQKIYITWGDHELAENIIHLVLARTPGAPEGSRGISLFVVPKYHVNDDGSLGQRNDLRPVSLEHKLGINASPTCVMSFGDNDECIGEMVGAENRGLAAMFTMMNNARINVGAQGVQIAERATQQAMGYARERIQSARAGSPDKSPVAIVDHPDVRRMLVRMKAQTEGMRALLYYTAGQVDRGALGDENARMRAEVLVPMLKAWATDTGIDVASMGVQIHGGMGFVEETGAAQHYRDARIAPIYEGTNGIQALDLAGRKVARNGGKSVDAFLADAQAWVDANADNAQLAAVKEDLQAALALLKSSTDTLLAQAGDNPDAISAGAVEYLDIFGYVIYAWLWAQMLAATDGRDDDFVKAKRITGQYYFLRVLPKAQSLAAQLNSGAATMMDLDADLF